MFELILFSLNLLVREFLENLHLNKLLNIIGQLFSYSHSEARGFLALLIISCIALFAILFPKVFIRNQAISDPEEIAYLDSIAQLFEIRKTEQFLFDPNSVSIDSLILLGFPSNIAQRLVNYREKGGRFQIKGDVKKVYGIDEELMVSIVDFIDLPDSITTQSTSIFPLNINTAKAEELKSVNLIGDVLANRIVKYRQALGGFVSTNQLEEVYGLTEPSLTNLISQVFVAQNYQPKKIRINHADSEDLMKHPYILQRLAEDIVRYREINSSIESEKVLRNFKSLDKSNFEKLILYLDFE